MKAKPVAKKASAKAKAVAKKPVAKKPVAKKPVAKKPVAKKATAKKPVAKKPVAKKPVAKKPVAKKPVAKKPVAKKPVAKKATAKTPVAKTPVAKKPTATKPVAKTKSAGGASSASPRSGHAVHERLRAIAEHAIACAKRLGVDTAEVSVATGHELEVSVRQGQVELVKEAGSSGLSVRIICAGRVATSSTTDLQPDAVESFLARAVEMASVSEPDEMAAPPSRRELARTWPVLDLFDPVTDGIDAAAAIEMATRAEAAALAYDPRISASEGASFGRSSGHSVLATTSGFMGERGGTYQSLVVQAVADDVGGKKRNGVHWSGGRFFAELDDAEAVGREAARRAVRHLGAQKIATAVLPVVFDKDAARGIIGLLAGCVLGDAIYRERSYLAQRLGTRVASELVTIVDDPLVPRGPGSRAFDGEGRPVQRRTVVAGGKLETFLLDTYSARKLDMAPTGSASGGGGIPHASTSNLFLLAGEHTPAQLLEGITRGLYVERMMGFGFDPTTGNFSRGAEGFLIEDGKLTTPISEITISRNLDDLLQGIDRVADDLDHRTATASPSFRVDQMTVAGS
ncbi:MAG: histone H1-like repetitive region-containing protein [Deltaproteobacteria bacterium]|nr:histone H1-like repetitive region-containing protein [Deltaproteobacteria bacterium]MBK8717932.1 histone H1-like repetitive region-containing protein [Deltaproteobacteria bacterium]